MRAKSSVMQFVIMAVASAPIWFPQVAAHAGPPPLPATYDAQTVQCLIASIDQGSNLLVLKARFMRRGATGMAASDVLAAVRDAVKTEKRDSVRWLDLNTVLGFGDFRSGSPDFADGYGVYNDIFGDSAVLIAAGSTRLLDRAIYEFVVNVPLDTDAATKDIALKTLAGALAAHLALVKESDASAIDIPWTPAIDACGDKHAFLDTVQAAVKAARSPSFELIATAAEVTESVDPKAANAYFEQAARLPAGSAMASDKFYAGYVECLERQNKSAEAVTVEQTRIKNTGRGRPDLLILCLDLRRPADYQSCLSDLMKPSASDEEIVEAGYRLLQRYSRDGYAFIGQRQDAQKLLGAYLASGRARTVVGELQARLLLGNSFLEMGDKPKALATLQAAAIPPASDVAGSQVFANIKRLIEREGNAAQK